MLADCGCLQESRVIFDTLTQTNIYSYNALIYGYINLGDLWQAKHLHQKMQTDLIQPTSYTFVALLTACSALQDLEWGYEIQHEIVKHGLEDDTFVGNALLNMFCKCGSLLEADLVFNKLSVRDVVSWSSIMRGYMDFGDHSKVLNNFAQMQLYGVAPNIVTFICTLKSCSALKEVQSGFGIYCEVVKMGYESDTSLANSIIDMFSKCGNLGEAQMVFDNLLGRDIVSWNSLLAGYVGHGLIKQASSLLSRMLRSNMLLDDASFLGGLRACANSRDINCGRQLYVEIVKRGMEQDFQIGNTLVDMFGKCSSLEEARLVFDGLPSRNVISLSAMMTCYIEHGFGSEALKCLEQIHVEGPLPDPVILTCCLKACCNIGAVKTGQEVHNEVIKYGFEIDVHTGTTLIDMYGEFGLLADARAVFDSSPKRNLLAWTALIKGYGINHESHMALQCFQSMQEEGIKPDAIVYTSLLVACSHSNLVSEGKDYFELMEKDPESWRQTIHHFACFLDVLARAGHINEAVKVLDTMRCLPPKEMCKALLSACKFYGTSEQALQCLQHLQKSMPAISFPV
ncbi:hypothetical protein KP509_27G013400 [Ceratopteris richardii]|nr:hypothetical protein KP509_27G013400 [Ceratopteris richardii]